MTLVSQAVAQHVINFAQMFFSPAQYMYVFSRMSNLLSGWKKNGKKGVGLAREVGPKHIGVSERGYVTCLLSPEI